jgi:signal transduction histidine kinase
VIAHATPFQDEFQRIAGSVNVLIDITGQKDRELRLKEEHRNKDNLLATLAHELRSPLYPILTNIEVLRRLRTGKSAFDAPLEAMERQLKHVVRVVDDLMDVSRINRNQLNLVLCRVNLTQVITDAIDSCRPFIEEQRHVLRLKVPKEELWIEADHVRLVQVFINLITNATKYTVSPGKIWVAATASGKEVVVTVRDSGSGLAPEMLGRVFEMFEQAGAGERSRGGLGLGLTLTKRLVEMNGGRIEARSKGLGKGSKFVVRLPLLHLSP